MKKFTFLLILQCFSAFAAVKPHTLSQQTLERFERVPEFEFIMQEAHKLGVKVYLFGGTASAFAHYVRWDLEREAGDDKYQAERFDYDFTNIYRGNQDLDIVVDGTPEQADQLKQILQQAYPHFIGNRDAWEVRLLKESRGDKRALLGDEDFHRQHSDTNSTGMLLLNPDPQGIVFNDLLNWGSSNSDFLNDVAAARIKFLFADEHEETERFKEGKNPPVLAAIRYLAKLAQYEVEGTKEDLKIVTQIIAEADFTKLSAYGKKKAEEFALKTLLNAPDSEYAWNLLDKTGARQKLIEMDGEKFSVAESLSWWMNKEPLRSSALGKEGKTARELFGGDDIIVSHETNSFKAYDNITRSTKGGANAFISRKDVTSEYAAHGDGFYTQKGQTGARGTGLTIRFKLHPDAREGIDFERGPHDFIIVKNKNALTLIQENLNLSIKDFFKLLLGSDIKIHKDKGLVQKFIRKFTRTDFSKEKYNEILQALEDSTFIGDNFPEDKRIQYEISPKLQRDFLDSHSSQAFYDLIEEVLRAFFDYYTKTITNLIRDPEWSEKWEQNPDWVTKLIEERHLDGEFMTHVLSRPYWINHPELIEKIMSKPGHSESIIMEIFFQPHWNAHPDLVWQFIKRKVKLPELVAIALAQEHWSDHPEMIKYLLEKNINLEKAVVKYVFSKPYWLNKHPQLLKWMIEKYRASLSSEIIEHVFTKEHSVEQIEILEQLIDEGWLNGNVDPLIITKVLSLEFWSDYPHLAEKIINKNKSDLSRQLLINVFSKSYWVKHHHLVRLIISKDKAVAIDAAENLLSTKEWVEHADILESLVDLWGDVNDSISSAQVVSDRLDIQLVKSVFRKKHWAGEVELFKKLVRRLLKRTDQKPMNHLIRFSLSQSHWIKHQDIITEVLNTGLYNSSLIQFVFSRIDWFDHADFLENFINDSIPYDDELLAQHVFSQDFWVHHPSPPLEKLIEKGSADQPIIQYVLSKDHWFHRLDLIKKVASNRKATDYIIRLLLSNKNWPHLYDLFFWMADKSLLTDNHVDWLFSFQHFQSSDLLKEFMDDEPLSVEGFKQKFSEKNYIDFLAARGEVSCQMLLE